MNLSHSARYLLLVGSRDAPRALLFNGERRYLAEVTDDDGIVLENLLRAGTPCPPPDDLIFLPDRLPPAPDAGDARCYTLG